MDMRSEHGGQPILPICSRRIRGTDVTHLHGTIFPNVQLEYVGHDGRTLWKVLSDFYVTHPKFPNGFTTIPSGWVTDLASVPRIPLAWFLAGGKAPAAAVVHDWLYKSHLIPRADTDAVFYDLIRREDYSRGTAWLMWSAVRFAGRGAWRKQSPLGLAVSDTPPPDLPESH